MAEKPTWCSATGREDGFAFKMVVAVGWGGGGVGGRGREEAIMDVVLQVVLVVVLGICFEVEVVVQEVVVGFVAATEVGAA